MRANMLISVEHMQTRTELNHINSNTFPGTADSGTSTANDPALSPAAARAPGPPASNLKQPKDVSFFREQMIFQKLTGRKVKPGINGNKFAYCDDTSEANGAGGEGERVKPTQRKSANTGVTDTAAVGKPEKIARAQQVYNPSASLRGQNSKSFRRAQGGDTKPHSNPSSNNPR